MIVDSSLLSSFNDNTVGCNDLDWLKTHIKQDIAISSLPLLLNLYLITTITTTH